MRGVEYLESIIIKKCIQKYKEYVRELYSALEAMWKEYHGLCCDKFQCFLLFRFISYICLSRGVIARENALLSLVPLF